MVPAYWVRWPCTWAVGPVYHTAAATGEDKRWCVTCHGLPSPVMIFQRGSNISHHLRPSTPHRASKILGSGATMCHTQAPPHWNGLGTMHADHRTTQGPTAGAMEARFILAGRMWVRSSQQGGKRLGVQGLSIKRPRTALAKHGFAIWRPSSR